LPATSIAQARYFRWREHNPAQAKAEGLKPMSKPAMHEFSSTPDKGLPYRARPHKEADGHIVMPAAVGHRRFYGQLSG
jgi:hypothetical protein